MELRALRVTNYRCIEDSGWVDIEGLNCLVGKNESGKTAFMQAVEKLNPSHRIEGYEPYRDYPRQAWPEYSERHETDPDVAASARLRLEPADAAAITEAYGRDLAAGPEAVVRRDYRNDLHWELDLDESACLGYLADEHELSEDLEARLREAVSESGRPESTEELLAAATAELGEEATSVVADEVGAAVLEDRLPEFRYLGEYATMDGTIEVEELLERREAGELDAGDRVFLSLLSVAGLELEAFADVDDWRKKTAELETAAASVNREVMRYWSQSGDVQLRIQATTTTGEEERRLLDVRVENREHNVTVEFEQRSLGFRRFFSMFCQLSALRGRDDDLVLLLDEPALNLHARAQQEFLAFLKEELAPEQPVVYTTHSPFMIDPEALHRVGMVRSDPVGEENVFTDVSLADAYTRFPLRNVLELDLMDTLLVRPQALLVERKADHVYLYVLSKMLQDAGETGLDERWTVVPIRDAANIGTFGSLFGGEELDIAALLNEEPSDAGVDADIPVRLVSEYTDSPGENTIEDVLSEPFYLEVVNRAYARAIAEADGVPSRITADELAEPGIDRPVVRRLEAYFEANDINDGAFDRAEVALYLQENRGELAEELDRESRRTVARLFTDLNNTLTSFEGVEPRRRSLFETLGLQ